MLLTGAGEQFNPGKFLTETSPYSWGLLGVAFDIGLSVVGAAWYLCFTPQSLMWQGNLHHRHIYSWGRCKGPSNKDKEPDIVPPG